MIKIGLATWTDHPALANGKKKLTLPEYATHFPIVEVDSSFYSVPKAAWIEKWINEVPEKFQFIVKANYAMTKTPMTRFGKMTDEIRSQRFSDFIKVIQPMAAAGKLASILFQFPPSFKCNNDSIQYIRQVRQVMEDLPISVEFRNDSWFAGEEVTKDTSAFLRSLKMTQVVVDEPHAASNGVPLVPVVTTPEFAFIRLHGRNEAAWAKGTMGRYRYDYNQTELEEIAKVATDLAKDAKEVAVIFNNNAGHNAAPNALTLKQILNQNDADLASMQLDLF
ncbi:hypothetical protein BGL34_06515 [Fructilactobacillus lindneri]|uniref:DUF72 domain-containing protein n=2 Tax=Fructilactobacillus lindneri TaxID=53444 RepID=A0A0R2K0H0_9LACO|nr:DUF72 domain-containing protein [Fructilactobacillus lindneri]ANZ57355.1 hypothetical protein AYR60_00420 [Fructilactobacillus lindneri]ANZ58620.1 hypothetical protein AYR59_00420 [Fructilactobacillus lindneri]KRN80709.1 hypothetical protein IV52_GL000773 [Fructilactobacillus lindneri DSM 20690 = JCM 11027]POG97658.1 hypothetical protein BGL31_06570 [Fructilactobacillus lindneri]POG98995.1 hypothetical protein BGL32_06555 [Fructilactobacillus lindneri]